MSYVFTFQNLIVYIEFFAKSYAITYLKFKSIYQLLYVGGNIHAYASDLILHWAAFNLVTYIVDLSIIKTKSVVE